MLRASPTVCCLVGESLNCSTAVWFQKNITEYTTSRPSCPSCSSFAAPCQHSHSLSAAGRGAGAGGSSQEDDVSVHAGGNGNMGDTARGLKKPKQRKRHLGMDPRVQSASTCTIHARNGKHPRGSLKEEKEGAFPRAKRETGEARGNLHQRTPRVGQLQKRIPPERRWSQSFGGRPWAGATVRTMGRAA